MKITREWLEDKDACPEQVTLFARLYPDGLEATPANAQVALDAGLDVTWAFQYVPLTVVLEDLDGTKKWFRDGRLHREDGPAVEEPGGNKAWHRNGLLHREGGPAIELVDSYKAWYRNGKRHRTGGPAVERPSGSEEWYIDGMRRCKGARTR